MSFTHAQEQSRIPAQSVTRLPIGENALPLFADRFRCLAMGKLGRLYFDTWAAFEGRQDCYTITGFGSTRRVARKEAAQILRHSNIKTAVAERLGWPDARTRGAR